MQPAPELTPAAAAAIPRRRFLQTGLIGGALLALGGGGALALRHSRLVPLPPEGLLVLGPAEYAVMDAFARRFAPPREGFPSHDTVRTAFNADRILARAEEGVRKDFKQLLGLFENALAGLLFAGSTKPFTQLDPEDQDRVIADWRDSRLALRRTGFQALRAVTAGAYYGSPLLWPALGYPGPPKHLHDPNAPVWKGGGAPRPGQGGAR